MRPSSSKAARARATAAAAPGWHVLVVMATLTPLSMSASTREPPIPKCPSPDQRGGALSGKRGGESDEANGEEDDGGEAGRRNT